VKVSDDDDDDDKYWIEDNIQNLEYQKECVEKGELMLIMCSSGIRIGTWDYLRRSVIRYKNETYC
jgi:hypothetical protein